MTEFSELIGLHMLSGLETSTAKINDYYDSDATVIYFVLDGVTYRCEEDPGDGYRSSMRELALVTDYEVKNRFPEQQVLGIMRPDGYYNNDVIEFHDTVTTKTVLALGTDSYDDYYPTFVFGWHPESMAINQDVDSDRQVGQE